MGLSGLVFDDDHITVGLNSFSPSGRLTLSIQEKRHPLGFYKITVNFASGNSIQIEYDGANPQRTHLLVTQTTYVNDTVSTIKVVRARN
jgi:hypothetical protein